MTLLLIVLLPFLVAWLPPLVSRRRVFAALAAAIPAATALGLLITAAPDVLAGEVLTTRVSWVPSLGLDFALRLDGLGLLFGLLITSIGLGVILYGHFYLGKKDPPGRFFSFLLLFMGAMLGVALSENLLFLLVAWELTSLSSFLLIGYWKHRPDARQGARQALTITGAGGLAMLAGFILLADIAGTWELTTLFERADVLQADPRFPLALGLTLLGAFTKSAQFPFHFWLPHAMAAPTPISAYLHSATMVKAGVFLLARLHPALANNENWFFMVVPVGLATLFFGAYHAFRQHDLKGLLAYSTISHLGLITTLLGFSAKMAAVAAVFHILNHAAFKASLFMAAGIVDHETGTRDLRVLGGLRKYLPMTFALTALGSAAMAGIPPLNGFISKEMFFEESLHLPLLADLPWLVPAIVTLGGLWSVAYSIRLVFGTFLGKQKGELPHAHPHEPPLGMRLPVILLVGLCIAIGLVPGLVEPLVRAAGAAVIGASPPEFHLALWHGVNTALLMSLGAVAGAIVWYLFGARIMALHERVFPRVSGKAIFEAFIDGLVRASTRVTTLLDRRSLQSYIAWTIVTVLVLGASPFLSESLSDGDRPAMPFDVLSAIMVAFLAVGAIATVRFHRKRMTALISLSIVGTISTLFFVRFAGPDLALTQISVEVVTILLLLIALYMLPQKTVLEPPSRLRVPRDLSIAILAGAGVAGLVYAMLTRDFETISGFYIENSVPGGGGANVVNVTLVDFRGFDTMGEISVLGIGGLGVYIMLLGLRVPDRARAGRGPKLTETPFPVILRTLARPLLPLSILVGVHIFLRGHNQPGGGFVAGLVFSIALALQYLSNGVHFSGARITLNYRRMIAIGMILAITTGLASIILGAGFLKSANAHLHLPIIGDLHLASAMAFDTGVFLAVVGAVLQQLTGVGQLSRQTFDTREFTPEQHPWKP